MDGLLGH